MKELVFKREISRSWYVNSNEIFSRTWYVHLNLKLFQSFVSTLKWEFFQSLVSTLKWEFFQSLVSTFEHEIFLGLVSTFKCEIFPEPDTKLMFQSSLHLHDKPYQSLVENLKSISFIVGVTCSRCQKWRSTNCSN